MSKIFTKIPGQVHTRCVAHLRPCPVPPPALKLPNRWERRQVVPVSVELGDKKEIIQLRSFSTQRSAEWTHTGNRKADSKLERLGEPGSNTHTHTHTLTHTHTTVYTSHDASHVNLAQHLEIHKQEQVGLAFSHLSFSGYKTSDYVDPNILHKAPICFASLEGKLNRENVKQKSVQVTLTPSVDDKNLTSVFFFFR